MQLTNAGEITFTKPIHPNDADKMSKWAFTYDEDRITLITNDDENIVGITFEDVQGDIESELRDLLTWCDITGNSITDRCCVSYYGDYDGCYIYQEELHDWEAYDHAANNYMLCDTDVLAAEVANRNCSDAITKEMIEEAIADKTIEILPRENQTRDSVCKIGVIELAFSDDYPYNESPLVYAIRYALTKIPAKQYAYCYYFLMTAKTLKILQQSK